MNEPGSSAGDGPSADEGSAPRPEPSASVETAPGRGADARPGISSTQRGKKKAKQASPEPAAPPEPEEVAKDAYVVALPTFEGPLDLLLHLIQKHELDILDIPVSFITEKYLAYINVMRELTIDVASEYLVMAATLTHIKSKMLLPEVPQDQGDGTEEEELDPREELVRRLLEYQKYKAAAEDLGRLETLGKDVFQRGATEPEEERPAPFAAFGVFDLLSAFSKILEKTKSTQDHEVVFDRISITDRIMELTDVLKARKTVPFEELFGLSPERLGAEARAPSRFDVVITFLAVLEMCRMRMMRVYQAESLSPIHVELLMVDENDDGMGELEAPREEADPPRPAAEVIESVEEPPNAPAPEPFEEAAPASEPAAEERSPEEPSPEQPSPEQDAEPADRTALADGAEPADGAAASMETPADDHLAGAAQSDPPDLDDRETDANDDSGDPTRSEPAEPDSEVHAAGPAADPIETAPLGREHVDAPAIPEHIDLESPASHHEAPRSAEASVTEPAHVGPQAHARPSTDTQHEPGVDTPHEPSADTQHEPSADTQHEPGVVTAERDDERDDRAHGAPSTPVTEEEASDE